MLSLSKIYDLLFVTFSDFKSAQNVLTLFVKEARVFKMSEFLDYFCHLPDFRVEPKHVEAIVSEVKKIISLVADNTKENIQILIKGLVRLLMKGS
jgi:hypothetical protein